MAVVGILLYIISDAIGFAAGYYLPAGEWTPYLPVVVAYHIFLIGLVVFLGINQEQKIGISLGIPMTLVSHCAFVGALVGVVFMREYVPLFGLVRYALPAMAPFEAKWLFEAKIKGHVPREPGHMPAGTQDDYNDFLVYLGGKDRRFQRAGRAVNEEYAAWHADRAKKRAQDAQEQEQV